MSTTSPRANYRIYDRTGGGATQDIYAESLEAAIEAGREWIEDGDWSSEDGTYRTIELDCCVREIVRYPEAPAEGQAIDEDGDLIDAEDYLICTAADMGQIDEDATADGDSHDCSGTYSDELPECEAAEDGEHDWRSPHSIVGGLKENPGVWSRGGTITTSHEVCACCGKHKYTYDAGNQRNPGEALETITLEDRDCDTEAWLKRIHEESGYLPQWLADYLDCEDETLAHMQEAFSDLQAEAQDVSHGIWTEIEETDLDTMSRDEAAEWFSDLTERLAEAKAEEVAA